MYFSRDPAYHALVRSAPYAHSLFTLLLCIALFYMPLECFNNCCVLCKCHPKATVVLSHPSCVSMSAATEVYAVCCMTCSYS